MRTKRIRVLFVVPAIILPRAAATITGATGRDWPIYGGGSSGTRYSPLKQINRSNVAQLTVAWTFDTADGAGASQTQTIVVDGVLYGLTPKHKVIALDGASGKELWRLDQGTPGRGPNRSPAAFVAQPANTWGSEGRNLLNAPGIWNTDLSLHREFRPTESLTLQFRWEAFDSTNTMTPAAPVSVLGAPNFGKIVTLTGSRQQQIALKILF